MINNYEIRENSLTQNSIYLLYLNADEQGCEDVQRELDSLCKLTDLQVRGFNYVFELPDVTDENMLERIRARLDFISSSVAGITQTFDNLSRTKIMDIEKTMATESLRFHKTSTNLGEQLSQENNKQKTEAPTTANKQPDTGLPSINLADSNFSISKDTRDDMDFKDVPAETTLVSGDEKLINIDGSSLKIEKTMPNIEQEKDPKENEKAEPLKAEKLSDVEEENKTIISFSPDEMKGVSMSIEKEKTGFIGGIFGKIKSAIRSKKPEQTIKEDNPSPKRNQFSDLIKGAKEIKEGIVEELKQEEPKVNTSKETVNPFQNLGEGLIVKKGMLNEEEHSANTIKKELSANPAISAKLKVDDIFAAETICDFYGNQPEGQTQVMPSLSTKKESPLEALEKSTSSQTESLETNSMSEDNSSSNIFSKPNKENPLKGKETLVQSEEKTNKEEITLPSEKVFTQNDLNRGKMPEIVVETKSKTPIKEGENLSSSFDKAEETLQEVLADKEDLLIRENKDENNDNTSRTDISKDEENKNMQEQNKEAQQLPRRATSYQKAFKTQKGSKQIGGKIDHTLHVATPTKNAKYRNYPIEMPLIPTYTFANMDISAIRFAHAMAMATLDDLGKSNNPFLLQGPSGTGKTHFLHAMGYEISKKVPQSKILFTNGVRFSRGVQYLLEQGQQEKLDKFFNEAEVLIVDDVHLTAVNEHNREYISKVLNDFLKNKKQIILSSKYPPESLKRFEELVNFKFSAGTIAELKVPNKAHFDKLTNKIVSSSFLDLTEKQVQSFFSDQNDSLGDVARNVKRVKVLSRRIESSGIKKMSYEEILKEMTAINGENDNSDIVKKDFADITVLGKNKENSWGNFGFFFPVSQIDKFRWIAFASQEAAKSLGIKGGFNYALKSAYSTEHIISAAFKIANICDLKGLKGAVILGPAFVECKEPIRDNFYDILTHMLEVMMIRCGTINFEDIKKPSAYVKMLGDILK